MDGDDYKRICAIYDPKIEQASLQRVRWSECNVLFISAG